MDYLNLLPQVPAFGFYILFIWSLFWKGIALWRAAKQEQRNWFIAILVLNTVGVLEIVYLFYFAKKKFTIGELKIWEHQSLKPTKKTGSR